MSLISAPDAIGHRDAIAGCDRGIGGIAVDLSQTAGGEQHGAGVNLVELAVLVEQANALNAAVTHQQVGGEFEFAEGDVLERRGLQVECATNLAAGGIAVRVQNAAAAVRAFASEGDFGSGAVELRAPLDQLFDARRAFFHQNARGLFVDQPSPALSVSSR